MRDHVDGWVQSSHRSVAVCNDCHTPSALIPKYVTKARNGFWHSFYFTSGGYPDPLLITPANAAVTERACRGCHAELTASIDATTGPGGGGLSCVRCHSTVGHLQ